MNQSQVESILGQAEAVLIGGHFVYASKKHGRAYINKDAVFTDTAATSLLCRAMAEKFKDEHVDVVIGPAVGGAILSQLVANHMSAINFHQVMSVFAEKDSTTGGMIIKRGYDKLLENKRVLCVEDVLNTGGSAKGVIEAVRRHGGLIVGVAAICNRGGVTVAQLGDVPYLVALMNVSLEAFDPQECPMCREGVPVNTEFGHGAKFLAQSSGQT